MASNDRWTYKVVKVKPAFLGIDPADLQSELDKLGAQGWELVNAVQAHPMHAVLLFMKRPA